MAQDKQQRVNDQITAARVRLIGSDGEQVGILSTDEALERATDEGLDLVEISPNADPPVCRIMDYGKFLYNASKKKQEARKKQKQIVVKEVKFRPGTDVGDYDVKLKRLAKFLQEGNKAKVTLRFRGREMAHQELGMQMLKRVERDLEEYATVEQHPKMEGRQMVMVLNPIRREQRRSAEQ
ncbi:MAG: translation initiation factor IF-3 [Gammaproteobacteria bacterium]|nr:translation initiation factor IF-3 [Gammaproteobacteria bacterium]